MHAGLVAPGLTTHQGLDDPKREQHGAWGVPLHTGGRCPRRDDLEAVVKFVHKKDSIKGWSSHNTKAKRVAFLASLVPVWTERVACDAPAVPPVAAAAPATVPFPAAPLPPPQAPAPLVPQPAVWTLWR